MLHAKKEAAPQQLPQQGIYVRKLSRILIAQLPSWTWVLGAQGHAKQRRLRFQRTHGSNYATVGCEKVEFL